MADVTMTFDEVVVLAAECLMANGADADNAGAVGRTIAKAERDGSASHGFFRLPGYVASLKSGKVNGAARPRIERIASSVLRIDADNGFAPLALEAGIPDLVATAADAGIAAGALVNMYHFAALWPEAEKIAEAGCVGFACTAFKPSVAPAGAREALFGTNPMAFAWPRKNFMPMVFDMATAAMARGEIQIAARDGHTLPPGVGLDKDGEPTTDPNAVLEGVMLPFGGYKGSNLSMMIELLVAALIGERFSFEAKEADNNDGGPPRGGEFLLAIDPARCGADDADRHAETFFERFQSLDGTRLPGDRRYANRTAAEAGIEVPQSTIDKVKALM